MRTPVLAFCLSLLLAGVAPAADSLHFRKVGEWGDDQLTGVAVKGQYAYVVGAADDQYDGLHVLSLADLAHPEEVWRCTTKAVSLDIAVSGEYLYYAEDTAGLRVFSISDPAHPVEVGRWRERGAVQVRISGTYAYTMDTSGLSIIALADPTHPTEVSHIQGDLHQWEHMNVIGDYVYTAGIMGGVDIVSVVDPTHPVIVGHYPAAGARGVAADDRHAYVGCDGSFRVVSIADPSSPIEVGRFDSTGFVSWEIVLIRGYALSAGGWNSGLSAISVSDPTHPTLVGYYRGSWGWTSLVTDGDYVYYGGIGLQIFQFYQLGDLDIDNDSLDVVADTLRLRGAGSWARGEFVLASTSTAYNPDTIDGPSVSPVDSLRCTGSLTGPGGTIDSVLIPNLPQSLAQGQTMVCTLAAYMPSSRRDGDYAGWIYISGKDTANLQVYESCYVRVSKLGDIDVDNDSLAVVADTLRLTNSGSWAIGEFLLANTSQSYNPDTSDGPSRSPVESLSFTASLAGPGGTLESIFIPNLPGSLAQGQTVVCTLAVYVSPERRNGDYAGAVTITGKDSSGFLVDETFYVRLTKLGDLDVDHDSLGVVHDTMNLHSQPAGPVYHPYAKAEFMLVNTSGSYNPDTTDGPSRSTLRQVEVEAKVEGQGRAARRVNSECRIVKSGSDFHSSQFALDSSAVGIYVLNLPDSLAVGQAVECTLALVVPVGTQLDGYTGWVTISAVDTLGYQVRDSFAIAVRGPQPRQNLDSLRVAPIPFKPNQNPEHDAIHFQGLSAGARVIVYDASGQSVWTATENGDGHLKWDAKVASGIYVYLVVAKDGESKVGKLSVIR